MTELDRILARYPNAETYKSGDSAALNAQILDLMRRGRKTMTCEAWEVFGPDGEAMPKPGRIDIALDWEGRPALAVRTLKVERVRYCDVTDAYVAPQGEFTDLADWRAGYRAVLTRAGRFREDMELMIETFEVVEDLAILQSSRPDQPSEGAQDV